MRRRRTNPAILIAALIAVAITTFWQQRKEAPAPENRVPVESRSAPEPPGEPSATTPAAAPANALDAITESSEERDALARTLARIASDGPFPYPKKDGTTFANREGKLPRQPRGYYREYTVPTRGSSDRGARRVVTGREGERWYTRDHYRTFIAIESSAPVR